MNTQKLAGIINQEEARKILNHYLKQRGLMERDCKVDAVADTIAKALVSAHIDRAPRDTVCVRAGMLGLACELFAAEENGEITMECC